MYEVDKLEKFVWRLEEIVSASEKTMLFMDMIGGKLCVHFAGDEINLVEDAKLDLEELETFTREHWCAFAQYQFVAGKYETLKRFIIYAVSNETVKSRTYLYEGDWELHHRVEFEFEKEVATGE